MDPKPSPKNLRPRALSDEAFGQIELDFTRGSHDDWEVQRLMDTVRVQRQVLRELFSYFRKEPLRLVVQSDPIRCVTLDELKHLVNMDDR